jgi:integrase
MVSYRLTGLGQRTKTFPTLRDARDFQSSLRDPAKAHQQRQIHRMTRQTPASAFPQWLERKRDLTPSTRSRYEGVGRLYIMRGRLGHLPITSVTRDDVEDWVTDLEREGVGRPTIDKAYRTLRAFLTDALEPKGLPNPARKLALPESDDRDSFYLDADQVDAVANEVNRRYRALVYFLAYTGARMGEATALRLRNVDLVRRRVTIAESSAEVSGRKLPPGKTKTKKVRTVHVSEALTGELAAHLDKFGVRTPTGDLDPEGFVFTGKTGAPVRQNNWRSREFQPACARAGIVRNRGAKTELPTVHDLRHTAISLAARAGYSLHEVKEMVGHSTIKTTSDRYLHLFEEGQQANAELLGQLMIGARQKRDAPSSIVALESQRKRG